MSGFLRTLFSWPNGIVVGNLLAAVIWAPLGYLAAIIHQNKRLKKHHERIVESVRKLIQGPEVKSPAKETPIPSEN